MRRGSRCARFTATWLSLSLVLAAFAEEIFWAGILAVPQGPDGGGALTGMSRAADARIVVLPQAVRITIPPLTNRMIAITKGTALGSVVAVQEILGAAQAGVVLQLQPDAADARRLAYLVLFLPVVILSRWVETRFAWKRRRAHMTWTISSWPSSTLDILERAWPILWRGLR